MPTTSGSAAATGARGAQATPASPRSAAADGAERPSERVTEALTRDEVHDLLRHRYHLQHHLLMTVPHYNLPRMHRMLRERGVLDGAWVARGYLSVLRDASSRPA